MCGIGGAGGSTSDMRSNRSHCGVTETAVGGDTRQGGKEPEGDLV